MAEIVEISTSNEAIAKSPDGLGGYVLNLVQGWEDHLESNYYRKWDEFNRLWRGHWAQEDRTRSTERSKLVTPALQQAVESSVAEVEEATFGKGKWFDISDDFADEDKSDMVPLRRNLEEDFELTKVRQAVVEVILTAAVYGTGIGELVLEEIDHKMPATKPAMDGQMTAFGVETTERPVVKLRPIHPKTFRIDPVATSIEEAHGVAIDEFVPRHTVEALMRSGVYKQMDIGNASDDRDLEKDPELDAIYTDEKVRLLKYYGLVPRYLLDSAHLDEGEEYADLVDEDEDSKVADDWDLVEALVVVANGGHVLKAEECPYMMGDRPVVAFSWDTVPGVFWGRGICEKGYNSQKALDAELRGRIDALSLTVHPMLAVDASRIPRGHKPVVAPGKMLLTNGPPNEVLHSFNFGEVSQVTFAQAEALQNMVQAATGAIDSVGIAGQVNGEATAAGISMSLGAIIKRHKRTLVNFQQNFLMPFVQKAAWRYMQFDPERYTSKDVKFIPVSTLGIIAREYEVGQLTQLLQTMNPQSPAYPALVKSIIENMNLSNREDLVALLDRAANPSPEEQEKVKRAQDAEMKKIEGQADMFVAQAAELNSQAALNSAKAKVVQYEAETDRIRAAAVHTNRDDQSEADFEKRLKIADLRLREREVNIKANAEKGKLQVAMKPKGEPTL